MVSTWKYLHRHHIVLCNFPWVFRVLILNSWVYLTSSKQLWSSKIKKSQIPISERAYHVRFKLVHGNINAFFLGDNKLLAVLQVMHIPQFDLTIWGCRRYLVILIESIELVLLLLYVELWWGDVLVICTTNGLVWVVTGFETQSTVFYPGKVPDGAWGTEGHYLGACIVIAWWFYVSVNW